MTQRAPSQHSTVGQSPICQAMPQSSMQLATRRQTLFRRPQLRRWLSKGVPLPVWVCRSFAYIKRSLMQHAGGDMLPDLIQTS